MALESGSFDRLARARDKDLGLAEELDTRPTLVDIVNDPQRSKRLGAMLEGEGTKEASDLGKRLLARQLTPDDDDAFDKYREELFKREKVAEDFAETLSEEHLLNLASYSPDMAKLVRLYGADNIREIARQGIGDLIFEDGAAFDAVRAQSEELQAFVEKTEKPLDEALKTFFTKYPGVSEDAFGAAMAIKDDSLREEQLRAAMRGQMGLFQKLTDRLKETLFKSGTMKGARQMSTAFTTAADFRGRLFSEAGGFLSATVSQNPDLRAALNGLLAKGGKPEVQNQVEEGLSFGEARVGPTVDSVVKVFEGLAKEGGADFDPEQGFAQAAGTLEKKYAPEKKKGFWGAIFGWLFKDTLKQAKRDPRIKALLAPKAA